MGFIVNGLREFCLESVRSLWFDCLGLAGKRPKTGRIAAKRRKNRKRQFLISRILRPFAVIFLDRAIGWPSLDR